MGALYIVATPIGNLKDITLRALEILKSVDLILAEDTRITKKLLSHYDIHTPLERYNEYYPEKTYREINSRLQKGESVALVSDAGTPAISDPGALLVAYINKELPEAKIMTIPGPSATVAALSIAGIFANQFVFAGYPPSKKKRLKFFQNLKDNGIRPIILYESPHRLIKTLDNLAEIFGKDCKIFIVKELTKIHEERFWGSVEQVKNYFSGKKGKGEFALIIP